MKKLYLIIICITLLFLRPIPVHADYLGDYEAPAKYKISMDAGSDSQTDGFIGTVENASKNRYAAYLDVVEKCIGQYGDTDSLDGPCYGMEHFTGLSFAKLIDFNDDGTEELFLVFYVRTNDASESYEDYVYIYNVWGYDGEQAILLQDGNYLYGFNGGYQAVFFVDNPFGTFFLHGAADSFQYDYYYGYEGDKFVLAKTLKRDEHYDNSSKRLKQVYTVDGKSVSQDFYKEESELWGTTSDPAEKYILTYSSDSERDKTYDMTYDTIVFLQQHSEELTITNEKGKTILNVQFHKPQKNPPVYSLIYKEFNTGIKKTIAQVQPPVEGDPVFNEEYTLSYDFSTDLQLESGSYQFFLTAEGADEDAEPYVAVSYRYDESEKFSEDDQYGNEREFRRLLSKALKDGENLSSSVDLRNNVVTRLVSFGLPRTAAESIADNVLTDSSSYGKTFLYVFYRYSLGIDEGNRVPVFNWQDNSIIFSQNYIDQANAGKISTDEITAAFLHEAGHALDHNASIEVPKDSSYQETMLNESVMESLYEDAMDIVEIDLCAWADRKGGIGNPKRKITKDDLDRNNPDSLLSKVGNSILSANYIEGYDLDSLKLTDPPELSEEELDVYYAVLHSMTDSIIFMWQDDFWDSTVHIQVMAVDILGGMTNSKIFVPKGILQNLRDDLLFSKYGHGRGFGKKEIYYWYNQSGERSWKIPAEAFAEYYSTVLTKNGKNRYINQEYFSKTCPLISEIVSVIEERLRDHF